jgi:hypothetical protein
MLSILEQTLKEAEAVGEAIWIHVFNVFDRLCRECGTATAARADWSAKRIAS